jgi:hypothetical protein
MFMQLTCEDYFLIEQIAHQQKTTPYRIASAVVKLWLHKQLVRVVPENSPQNPPSE